ncbi:hypothetical protein [Burkholderia thailandensis]|uniref:Uncharacterized protein n=1 Tax=Burkholderia thailandensis TaxID=57975 RepID=A0AAW9CQ45_BURTH|nr:hypothetical protein [Burkholderia thailandensis]AHI66860.1 hypothetical protein BTL_4836 [Burkholderia thailandensis H0587]AJY32019.1 hypothetical protein BTM_4741 [Burkholderia thailandensis 34]MCS3393791.1 hypothetical protein [Burkholderia thailandensis]MCS6426894.1 hypothetical protein [Burkholderia thailandensis]MCS6454361.1 hypothetical protein [Burkholderia thailandensis]
MRRIGHGTHRRNPAWSERLTNANVESDHEVSARYPRIMKGRRISPGVAR